MRKWRLPLAYTKVNKYIVCKGSETEGTEMHWKNLNAEPPESGTFFVAIPSDGSGARLYIAVDADGQGGVNFLDCEYHEIADPDGIFLDGSFWAEAPKELVEPFFLRDA